MENQLIQLYVLVCHVYDTQSETCFQRLSKVIREKSNQRRKLNANGYSQIEPF
jgi:hypothetical protein